MSSPYITRNVTTKISVNLYGYHSRNLLLSYGLAIFFSLMANILGVLAFCSNGKSYDKSVAAIISATRHWGLADLFHKHVPGTVLSSGYISSTKLKFGKQGFTIVPDGVKSAYSSGKLVSGRLHQKRRNTL